MPLGQKCHYADEGRIFNDLLYLYFRTTSFTSKLLKAFEKLTAMVTATWYF